VLSEHETPEGESRVKHEWRGTALVVIVLAISFGNVPESVLSAHEKGESKHWMAPREAANRRNPVARTRDSIERGKILFQTHCVCCHGEKGRGDGAAVLGLRQKPPDLGKMARHHPDGDLAWKIAEGRGAMPGWKQILPEEAIWDLVNFVRSLGR
jgi:mono/diheme cytochrome c family protein